MDAEKEKFRLNSEYDRIIKQAIDEERTETEHKMRIANTLRAVYKHQENEKKMRCDSASRKVNENSVQENSFIGSDQLALPNPTAGTNVSTTERPYNPYKQYINRSRGNYSVGGALEIKGEEDRSARVESSASRAEYSPYLNLYGITALGNDRVINVAKHQTRRHYREPTKYSKPDVMQYDGNPTEKFAGVPYKNPAYNIINGVGSNPKSFIGQVELRQLPGFLKDKFNTPYVANTAQPIANGNYYKNQFTGKNSNVIF